MQWLRNNLVLVAGIVLPILLVAGFLLLQAGSRAVGAPPLQDFLVVGYHYDANRPLDYHLDFEVRDQRLVARGTPVERDHRYPNRRHATLYRYDRATDRFEEIAWTPPQAFDTLEEAVTVPVPELDDIVLDKARQARDGYVFQYASRSGHGGVLGALFGMDYGGGQNFILKRSGESYRLPELPNTSRYHGDAVHFLGWVIDSRPAS